MAMYIRRFIQKYGMRIIFLQALVAMLGSLYYGWYGDPLDNILVGKLFDSTRGFQPCELCRYARILMYPLVIISLVALCNSDKKAVDYIIPFAGLGLILEIYHYVLQKFPILTSSVCTWNNPCAALDSVNYFGFITIPFLCGVAFLVILLISVAMKLDSYT